MAQSHNLEEEVSSRGQADRTARNASGMARRMAGSPANVNDILASLLSVRDIGV